TARRTRHGGSFVGLVSEARGRRGRTVSNLTALGRLQPLRPGARLPRDADHFPAVDDLDRSIDANGGRSAGAGSGALDPRDVVLGLAIGWNLATVLLPGARSGIVGRQRELDPSFI